MQPNKHTHTHTYSHTAESLCLKEIKYIAQQSRKWQSWDLNQNSRDHDSVPTWVALLQLMNDFCKAPCNVCSIRENRYCIYIASQDSTEEHGIVWLFTRSKTLYTENVHAINSFLNCSLLTYTHLIFKGTLSNISEWENLVTFIYNLFLTLVPLSVLWLGDISRAHI